MLVRRALIVILTLSTSLCARQCLAQGAIQAVRGAAEALEGWQPLFDGQSLDGWTASENKGSCKVVDGELVIGGGERSHLFYSGPIGNHDFTNFQLKLKVKVEPKSNSGVYIHTEYQEEGWPEKGYECQVNNSGSDPRKTGGLYGVKDIEESPVKDDEWFDYVITVEGNRITTAINGETLVDFTETGDEMPHLKEFAGRKLSSGTVALQAHDPKSIVHYKDIQIRLLP